MIDMLVKLFKRWFWENLLYVHINKHFLAFYSAQGSYYMSVSILKTELCTLNNGDSGSKCDRGNI